MVKTRRKSKAAAAAAAAAAATAEQELETASTQGTEDLALSAFLVPIPPDLDTDTLAHILPDASFAKPDPETVLAVYRLLLAQVADQDDTRHDLEELRAEAERKDIELDQAIQDGETKTRDLEDALDSLQKEVATTKDERDHLVASNKDLEARISSFTSSQSSSVSDLDHLRNRVDETDREKRDLIGVVSRLKEDASQRDDEVQSLRAGLRQARQDHQALETRVCELRSTETSTKFKLETLSQQLALAQSESERVTSELTAKSEEYANFRRTKHAEFIQLQSAHDSLSQKNALTESSLRAIQSAQTASTQQLTQSLAKVQDLQGRLAEQEAAFTAEVSGLKRLVTIMEERERQAKDIVENIEREWAGVGDRAEKREAALRAETEKERRAREDVEKRLEQLETVMERMHRGDLPIVGHNTFTPATPGRASGSHGFADPMLGLSPTVAMASRVQKSGKTFTQVYADYVRLEEEYAKKSAEYDHMDRTLSDVLAQIEERAPALAQQREEHERLKEESIQLANQLSTALAERDANAVSFQDVSQKLKKSHQETNLLQHQLTDLGRQVQSLLKELGRRTDPLIPSDEELDEMEPLPADNIDAVITNNLVLFRSIPSLQEQNLKLLKIVRELGAKMEAEEREYREALEKEQSEAVREAHEAMQDLAAQLERQKRSNEATVQAYMKERDTLKAMLARTERTSLRGGVNGDVNGTAPTAPSDLVAELEDVQAQFESYRVEMGMDAEKLREDLAQAQRQLGQANAALAKATAKIEFLDERQHMTQEQLNMQNRDLDSLTLRNQQLYDQQTRLDIDRERVMDELAVTKSDLEQLRNEAANLRAEKKIWESVQTRLIEENKNLAVERSRLSDLMVNVQRMHNDLERSGENDRRRLETQVQMMDNQTQDLKSQLSQERETIRHVTLQKDIDVKDLQSRLDKTTEQLSQARESLIGAETSKTHLQERVEELGRQLQGNVEKLAVYERRSTGTSAAAAPAPDPDLPREQQLEQEVADLRARLKVTQVDLAAARNHMQQFQEISQASEAALAALNTTHDEYKADAEAQLARHELEYKSLEEKLHSVQHDLQQWTNKFNELQKTLVTERSAWANDKKTLEDTIVDMSTSERHSEIDRTAHEREVRALEERAVAAEDRYSREVVTHAESFKTIEKLKQQLGNAQAASRQNLAEVANAQAKLEASEGSWKQQKEALDKEVADLNARCKDLAAQNTLLYQHLDSVSSQAARIRQVADSATESSNGDADVGGDVDTKLSDLRSVVAYLRKEKEIVDLQLELSKQENIRLKTQLDHLSQSLQEVRKTLSEERERAVQAATSDAQHAEMLERINQLNILRESNVTLRADCETYSKRSRELDAKLKALSAELEPTKEQARVARAELQARDAQITLLESESKRWQERNAQLLSKYDRIDPADLQTLKEEVENLKTQKTDVEKRLAEQEAKESENTTKMATYDENMRKLRSMTNNLKQQLGASNSEKSTLNRSLADLQAELKSVVAERDSLRSNAGTGTEPSKELASQLESLRQEKVALEKALADEKASKAAAAQATSLPDESSLLEKLRIEKEKWLAEKESWNKSSPGNSSDAVKAQLETEKAELTRTRDEALERLRVAEERANKAIDDARNLKQSNEKFQIRVSEMQRTRESAIASAVEKAKSEINTFAAIPNTDEMVKKHAQEIEALRAGHEAALRHAVEAAKAETVNASSDDATKAAIVAAIAAHDRALQAKHAEEISAAVERGRMEQGAKSKLKDAQLVRSQNKLKELEAQVLEWRKAGLVPDPTAAAAAPAPAAATAATVPASPAAPPTTPTVPIASTSKIPPPASPVVPVPAPAASISAPVVPTPAAPPPSAGPARRALGGAVPLGTTDGRGRGAPRGRARGISIRGAAPSHRGGAGAVPSPTATAAVSSSSATTVGVQIMGAANKRGREDETQPDDSLVKRLKPAGEGVVAAATVGGAAPTAAGGSKPPVAIRRPLPS